MEDNFAGDDVSPCDDAWPACHHGRCTTSTTMMRCQSNLRVGRRRDVGIYKIEVGPPSMYVSMRTSHSCSVACPHVDSVYGDSLYRAVSSEMEFMRFWPSACSSPSRWLRGAPINRAQILLWCTTRIFRLLPNLAARPQPCFLSFSHFSATSLHSTVVCEHQI